jgi:mannitol/fructose-specific phosphotransferase system IIA component (Ntr-type)
MALHDYCDPDAVLCTLDASDKQDALNQLVDALVATKSIPKTKAEDVRREILQRESQASTGIGRGIGVPHARTDLVKKMAIAIGRVPDGIAFGAIDGEPVKVIMMLVSPPSKTEEHLAAMKTIVSIARDPYNSKRMQGCLSPQSFIDLLAEVESEVRTT